MKAQPIPETEFTAQRVAKETNLTPSRIRQLIADKIIVGYKPDGSRDWWIPESQVAVILNRTENRGRKKNTVE